VSGWDARPLADIPLAHADEPDPEWRPLQHFFRLSAFGANAFTAREAGAVLVEEHDETASGQEELYVVVSGSAAFVVDGERVDAPAVTVVAVRDAAVRRAATAAEPETTLLALGAPARERFESTWHDSHFEGVPRT
jgi:mannose-6-phosphate isomerase-like protein (cupin superfamily)